MRGATTEDIGDKRPDDSSSLHPCPSPTICVAIMTAEEKLKQLGRYLPAPHSRAVEGKEGRGRRELRPRGGKSRWRPLSRQIGPETFVILAVAPEVQTDQARTLATLLLETLTPSIRSSPTMRR